jgi:hypothetical protein
MAKGKASVIVLSSDERRELESLTRRRATGQALALRARIVLAAVAGWVVAINRNAWSQSIGIARRDHPVRAHFGKK